MTLSADRRPDVDRERLEVLLDRHATLVRDFRAAIRRHEPPPQLEATLDRLIDFHLGALYVAYHTTLEPDTAPRADEREGGGA